jgi:DNA mismatch repair protein MutS
MEGRLKRVKNFHFAVQETNKDVVFLRKLILGATDKSYGIHVARLAGIPKKVTDRADAILTESLNRAVVPGAKPQRYTQLLLVDDSVPARAEPKEPDPVVAELSQLNPDTMTPIQALAKLAELKSLAKKSSGIDSEEAER